MAAIVLEGLGKRFEDGTWAVRGIDLEIAEGEFFVLVGPSGCGKSTLLNLIVGLDSASEGVIRLDGRAVNELDPKDRNMAMVFQSYAIYPHMSVRDNLAFPLKLAKRPRAEVQHRVRQTAELLELEKLLDRSPATLSGGQRQRVAMGRAIIRQPAVFLMDEPLSNLDAKLRTQMRHDIARLQRRLGVTTVYVTHDQTEAMTLADRMAVLRDGAVQQIGTPEQLYRGPANRFVAEFIGTPAMNLLPVQLRGGEAHLPFLALPVESLPEPAKRCPQLLAGIRAEQFLTEAAARHLPRFTVRVAFSEWLGADQYVYFDVPGAAPELQAIARVHEHAPLPRGTTLRLAIDPAQVAWFDGTTGQRL